MHSKTAAPLLAIETGTNLHLSYINPLSLSLSLLLSRGFSNASFAEIPEFTFVTCCSIVVFVYLLFYLHVYRVNREGYTPVNAACLNSHSRCVELLVKHGGCLQRVSVSQRESAIETTEKIQDKKMIKLLSQLLQSGVHRNHDQMVCRELILVILSSQ